MMADTDTDLAAIALAAHDAGLCVIPIKSDGSKKPPVKWKQYQAERPTREQVAKWFGAGGWQAVAVICGRISGGLVMLEMEGDFFKEGYWQRFRDEVAGRLGAERWAEIVGYVELSPSGGPHVYMLCEGFEDGNEKLAKALRPNSETGEIEPTDIMETRGEGGYSVIAGSVGHESGNPWRIAHGESIAHIATITADELEQILAAARTLDELPEVVVEPIERREKAYDGESWMEATIEAFNRRHSPLDFLKHWSPTETETYKGETVTRLHRDGSKNPHGATLYQSGRIGFFSSNAPTGFDYYRGTPGEKLPTYDAFTVSLIEDGRRDVVDDRVQYALELREQGYGPPLNDKPKTPEFNPPPPPPPSMDPETGEIDNEPLPLGNPLSNLPGFPLDVLPDWMRDEAEAAADALQVPVEMTAFLGIMALSICVAGKVEVDGINWRQPLNIYGAITAPTGTGKSPAADRMLAPLRELEAELHKANAELVAYSEAEATSHANAVAEAEKSLKGDPGSVSLISALADARATANEHRVLSDYRMTVDDHTPEALSLAIASQVDERIAVVSPEGASLFESMTGTRYQQPNKVSNVPDVYLKSWGGEQISVDRVGRSALVIKRPILSVCVMVQPEVITALSANPMIARQGGLARFLWVAARNLVGYRDRKRRRGAGRPSATYRDNLLKIGRWAAGLERGGVVYLATEDAADVVDDLADEREARMRMGGDLEAHVAIEAKMLAYHWRLAALLAIAHDDRGDLTAERTLQAAELVEFFMAHATAIHSAAGLDDHTGPLKKVAGYLLNHVGEDIDWADFRSKMRSVADHLSDLVPVLEHFVALRWLIVHEGDLTTLGVQGAPNSSCSVNVRLRAFSHGA